MNSVSARTLVSKILYDVIVRKENLKRCLTEKTSNSEQAPFIQSLCYETLRHYGSLQKVWGQHVKKKPKDKLLQILLTQAVCEKVILNKPDHAVVNESLKVLNKLKKSWAKGLVNATLRSCFKNSPNADELNPQDAHPQWWQEKIARDWEQQLNEIYRANTEKPPLWVRALHTEMPPENWLTHPQIEGAFKIPADSVSQIHGFKEGRVSIQDASAQLAAHILNPQPNEKLLDACAAPGGKTGHLLELCPEIQLDALEKHPNRANKINSNLARIGHHAHVIVADARQTSEWFNGQPYDKILLDVPCSASGILRRQPDIKFHRSSEQMLEILNEQSELLKSVSQTLKVDGWLLYVTCSVFSEENQQQIQRFLSSHDNFKEIPLKYPFAVPCSPGIQILPGTSDMDGFYYCLLTRTH